MPCIIIVNTVARTLQLFVLFSALCKHTVNTCTQLQCVSLTFSCVAAGLRALPARGLCCRPCWPLVFNFCSCLQPNSTGHAAADCLLVIPSAVGIIMAAEPPASHAMRTPCSTESCMQPVKAVQFASQGHMAQMCCKDHVSISRCQQLYVNRNIHGAMRNQRWFKKNCARD